MKTLFDAEVRYMRYGQGIYALRNGSLFNTKSGVVVCERYDNNSFDGMCKNLGAEEIDESEARRRGVHENAV